MSNPVRKVLISGCSDGGLGAALAIAFHEAGMHVYATARDPSKMTHLASLGIETLTLDVLSDSSIAICVEKLQSSGLDILVNNAGAEFLMPLSDVSIPDAKKIFDLNVWSYIATTQAFLPLLLKSPKAMIVNHTSGGSVIVLPFQSVYTASKAAMAMFSNTMRVELEAFGIAVVELKTGVVRSNLIKNQKEAMHGVLPAGSIYQPAKEAVENVLRQDSFTDVGMPSNQWAKLVVQDLLRGKAPPIIWRGESSWLMRLSTVLPFGILDGTIKKISGFNTVEEIIHQSGK